MFKNKKIIATLMVLSIVTSSFTIAGRSAKASELYLSQTEITQVSDLLNNVLSSEQEIMKTGKSKDYSNVINDKKLYKVMQTKDNYKKNWYNDANYKIYDYTSNAKINNITKLTDKKYILDVTFQAELVLSKDSQTTSKLSDYYVFEIENKSGQWVINKMVNKDDYQDIVKEKSNISETKNNDTDILANNDTILDENLNDLEKKSNNIDQSVKDYKETMAKIKDTLVNGSEKATPAYSGTNRTAVASYAYKYAINHNSIYTYYSGADCTNFASQSVYNGGVPGNSTWTTYSTAWINVESFYSYMSNNGYLSGSSMNNLSTGDVVQWKHWFNPDYSHSTIVTGYDSTFGVLLSAHSNDRQNYPLANYWSDFNSARDMHFW